MADPARVVGLLIALAAGACAGCLAQYHPVAPRPPAVFMPVELGRYQADRWPAHLDVVAERDVRVRRFALVQPGAPLCSAGAQMRWVDRLDFSSPDVDIARGQRLRLGFKEMAQRSLFEQGPTWLDVEEVLPGGGTACLRIPVSGDRPEEQWMAAGKWGHMFDVGYGRVAATAGDSRPIRFGASFDASAGVGRWLGPVRVDGAVLVGTVGCAGCVEPDWLPKAGGHLGVALLAWESDRGVLELGGAYRLVAAKDRDDVFGLHAARVTLALGLKNSSAVGIIESARTGFGAVALYGEWRAPVSSRAAPQLLVGVALMARFFPF